MRNMINEKVYKVLTTCMIFLFIVACAPRIRGVTNTNFYNLPDSKASYVIERVSGNPMLAPKIEKMLHYQMKKLGFIHAENKKPEIKLLYVFDVVPAGSISLANTFMFQPMRTATVIGDTIYESPTSASGVTVTKRVNLYTKSIVVRIIDANTEETLWEALTEETGWCNRIFVTAPEILAVMFENYPFDKANVSKDVYSNDPVANEYKALFPDTYWGCR